MSENLGRLSVVEVAEQVVEDYNHADMETPCIIRDHPDEETVAICLPPGGHRLIDEMAARGYRVCEIPNESPPCNKKRHTQRVYFEQIGRSEANESVY